MAGVYLKRRGEHGHNTTVAELQEVNVRVGGHKRRKQYCVCTGHRKAEVREGSTALCGVCWCVRRGKKTLT